MYASVKVALNEKYMGIFNENFVVKVLDSIESIGPDYNFYGHNSNLTAIFQINLLLFVFWNTYENIGEPGYIDGIHVVSSMVIFSFSHV